MKSMNVALLIFPLVFLSPIVVEALVAPDAPTIEENRDDYLCEFLLDYELAQLAFKELPETNLIEKRKDLLERARMLACNLGHWYRDDLKNTCLKKENVCYRSHLLVLRTTLPIVRDAEYQQCQDIYKTSLASEVTVAESSWADWMPSRCQNLWQSITRNFQNLAFYLGKECENRAQYFRVDAAAIHLNIAKAKSLKPTFASVSEGRISWVSHFWCALNPYVSMVTWMAFENGAPCYEYVIDSYIQRQQNRLDIALAFEDMCANVDRMNVLKKDM